MRIAIIYHTLTGNTKKLAELMQSKLVNDGHDITMIELKTDVPVKHGTIRQPMNFEITNLQDISNFDAVCVGGPVWAFGPSPVIYKAIKQLGDLRGKCVLPFVTMGFPFAGMGGSSAIGHMGKAISTANGNPLPGIVLTIMFRNVAAQMDRASNDCLNCFRNMAAS